MNTEKIVAQLLEDKKEWAIKGINIILSQKLVLAKQIKKLLDFLKFCISVFPISRSFLQHV